MADRLLVFGGGGFVGGNLCTLALRAGGEVHVADASVRNALTGATWHAIDITRAKDVETLVAAVEPTAVVDLAAVADVDRAERERELARAVNVDAARSIAAASARARARCIYFSSDAVFGGTADIYAEDDALAPVNWYGQTKADGEQAVRAAHPGAVVLRISLALGFPVTDGNSFLDGLQKKLAAGTPVPCPTEEIRTPIDVLTLSECVLELCRSTYSGVLHLGSTNSVDRYTLTRRAAALLGFRESLAMPQEPGPALPGRAPRHKRGVIDVSRARQLLSVPMLNWESTLQRAINDRLPKNE
jgi:dTDP-4-dehydrorhamnose reductase